MAAGTLYLIPAALGEASWQSYLPPQVRELAIGLDYFIVENAKSARAELKRLGIERPLQELEIRELPSNATAADVDALLIPLRDGRSAGVLSEAGCPAVADPGATLVRAAHECGLRVSPLVGPSSILLSLMASGLNGQNFAFRGYLPIKEHERVKAIQDLERESRKAQRTQIFIEAPYRNEAMFASLLDACQPATQLCVASNLTLPTQVIATHPVSMWRLVRQPTLNRQPTVFLLLAQ